MRLGFGLGLSKLRAASGGSPPAPFNPATLFNVGDQGAIFDLSDASTRFQTTDTSTPATTAGQNLSRVNDLSPNGNNWLVSSGQPIFGEDGAVKYAQLDGVDDALSTGSITGLLREGMTVMVAMRIASGGASAVYNPVFSIQGGNANDFMRITVRSDVMRKSLITRLITNGRAQLQGPTDPANNGTPTNTYIVLTMTFSDTEQNLAQNGTFLGAAAHSWANTDQIAAAITTGLAAFGVSRRIVAAFSITRVLSGSELALMNAWMDARINP